MAAMTADSNSCTSMKKILVFGAGVLGSLYAGKLCQAGYDVTILARGQRLEELRRHDLVLVEDGSSQVETIPVPVTDRLLPGDAYDLILVIVRKNQLPTVLPALAANTASPNVLFLVNNAEGPEPLVKALGTQRVLLGFPGAGGQREAGIVRYKLTRASTQPTTIGELDGSPSGRIARIAGVLGEAGFPIAVSENMDAWLKTHVALVSPIANALYLAGGNNYRLAHTRDGLVLMIRALKEGLRVLLRLHIPITPAKYRLLLWIPEPILVAVLQKSLDTPQAELVLARHANAARDEMRTLAEEFRALAHKSGELTPAIDALACYLNPDYPILPEGQAKIKLGWGSIIAAGGTVVFFGLLINWLQSQRRHS